jgi:hypothetical protein
MMRKILLTIIISLLLSCSAKVYTEWSDDKTERDYKLSILKKDFKVVKIINHNGIYEILYKDK